MGIHRSLVPALMPWSRNIKRGPRDRCSIESIRRSRIEVPHVDYEKLSGDRMGEPPSVFVRVSRRRGIFKPNDMPVGEIRQFCKLQDEGAVLTVRLSLTVSKHQSLMRAAMTQMNLSARAYHRTRSLKLACTIADLAECEEIQSVHLAEALQYRPKLILS